MVEFYKGNEVDRDKIQKIKGIAKKGYSPAIFNEYFQNLNDVEDLSHLHGISIDMERLIIGSNWFICYSESKYYVTILEWISVDERKNMKQTLEMMNTLKQIFIANKGKVFAADMRHDTSYKMYLKMLQDGYFKEINHQYMIDCAAPDEIQEIKYKYIEDFLTSSTSDDYVEYFKYILHHLSFILTDKFIEKYGNISFKLERKL